MAEEGQSSRRRSSRRKASSATPSARQSRGRSSKRARTTETGGDAIANASMYVAIAVALIAGALYAAYSGLSVSSLLLLSQHTAGADTAAFKVPPGEVDASAASALQRAGASLPPVLWMAPFVSGGGYCSEALSFVLALQDVLGPPPHLLIAQHGDTPSQEFFNGLDPVVQKRMQFMAWSEASKDGSKNDIVLNETIVICHSEPGAWAAPRPLYQTSLCPPTAKMKQRPRLLIGRTMFETDRIPNGWTDRLNMMDFVWVPTAFHLNVFLKGGVDARKLRVVHEPVDTQFFDPASIESAPHFDGYGDRREGDFRFLSIFKWEERKGWRFLLEAFAREFGVSESEEQHGKTTKRVALYILTNEYHEKINFRTRIDSFIDELDPPVTDPRVAKAAIKLLPSGVPSSQMPSLYAQADCFVLPSRGEGWGRPHVEAMSMALPVIATAWSGPTEFMTKFNAYLLRVDRLEPIESGPFQGHMWARPNVNHLRELMAEVVTDRGQALARGVRARKDMVERFCQACLAQDVIVELQRALSGT